MSCGCEKAIRAQQAADPDFAPELCIDRFHVVQLANRTIDQVRRAEWNQHGNSRTGRGCWVKSVRWSLLKAPEHTQARPQRWPKFNRRGAPRRLADLGITQHAAPFIKLAATVRRYRHGILAAIRLGLSNSRLEALNNKVRLLLSRRS